MRTRRDAMHAQPSRSWIMWAPPCHVRTRHRLSGSTHHQPRYPPMFRHVIRGSVTKTINSCVDDAIGAVRCAPPPSTKSAVKTLGLPRVGHATFSFVRATRSRGGHKILFILIYKYNTPLNFLYEKQKWYFIWLVISYVSHLINICQIIPNPNQPKTQ